MKVAIITYDEYINIPYINKYEKLLKRNEITYDVILWKRSGNGGECHDNHYIFRGKNHRSKFAKIIPFLQWRKFALEILRSGQYDKLIVLTTMPGVLIFDFLLKHYAGSYFLDIRDFTYENFWVYKKIVSLLVTKSKITSISSKAFMEFLPNSPNIVVTHNISNHNATMEHAPRLNDVSPIIIGFVGGIRYYQENCDLLIQLKNKPHFHLRYVGKVHPGCDLRDFCIKHEIYNVSFLPSYENTQKPQIYRKIDLINAIYGNKTKEVALALPNKLYDCILFKKPIIVSNNTYLAEIVRQYHLGLAVDLKQDDIEKSIEDYVVTFDAYQFENGCNEYLKLVIREENLEIQRISDYLKERE